jgi:hypothetical protein
MRVIKSRRMRVARHITCMGEIRNTYSALFEQCGGKGQIGRLVCKWENNIKMDIK